MNETIQTPKTRAEAQAMQNDLNYVAIQSMNEKMNELIEILRVTNRHLYEIEYELKTRRK